jgi:hypothetical protein
MPSTTTAGAKICCKCGADVAGKKRLKDRDGRYWCADCSKSDAKRQKLLDDGICAGCGEPFTQAELTVIGDSTYCKPCLRVRARQETSGFAHNVKDMLSGSRDQEKRTTLMLIIVSAVIVAAAVWHWVA